MDLVFVHGINQQGKTADTLSAEWSIHLREALDGLGVGAQFDALVPFYGDILYDRTRGADANRVTPQGAERDNSIEAEEARFLAQGLEEIAQNSDEYSEAEIEGYIAELTDGEAEAQGWLPMHRRVNAMARFLERISPWEGDIAVRFLKQAYTYLRTPGVADEVEAVVRPMLSGGPRIVVAHSLGTIVCFRILRRMALEGKPGEAQLFLTLGSPLSLRTVRNALGPKFLVPEGVNRWINAYDPDDAVSLGQGLTEHTFAAGIENVSDVRNVDGDAHAIEGYLKNPRVAAAISALL